MSMHMARTGWARSYERVHGEDRPGQPQTLVAQSVHPLHINYLASARLLSALFCHNGAGRHSEIVTRQETDDVLRYREYGPTSRRYPVRPQPGRRHNMPARRLADEDKSLFVTMPLNRSNLSRGKCHRRDDVRQYALLVLQKAD
eukprot:365847-Chlamydomonas_euryale.AAC.31